MPSELMCATERCTAAGCDGADVPSETWWLAHRDGNLSRGLNSSVQSILGVKRRLKTTGLVLVLAKTVRLAIDSQNGGIDGKARPINPSVFATLRYLIVSMRDDFTQARSQHLWSHRSCENQD